MSLNTNEKANPLRGLGNFCCSRERIMTICIKEYQNDIKSAVGFMAEQVMKDNPDFRQAYQYIIHNGYAEEVANWIIGDPAEASDEVVEVYYAIERAAKKEFKTRLLGVY